MSTTGFAHARSETLVNESLRRLSFSENNTRASRQPHPTRASGGRRSARSGERGASDGGGARRFSTSPSAGWRVLLVSLVCSLLIVPPLLVTDALAGVKKPKSQKLALPKGIKLTKVKQPLILAAGLGDPGPITITPTLPSQWAPASGGVLKRGDVLVGLNNDLFGGNPGGAVVQVVMPTALPSRGRPPADSNGDGISDNVFPFSDSTKKDPLNRRAVINPRGLAFPSMGFLTIGNFGDASGGQAGMLSAGAAAVGTNGNFNPFWDTAVIDFGFPSNRPSLQRMLDVPGGGVKALTFGGFAWNNNNFRASPQIVRKPDVKDLNFFMCNADGSIRVFRLFSNVTSIVLPAGQLMSCDGLSFVGPPRELRNLTQRGPADPVGTFSGFLFVLETANNSIAVVQLAISGSQVGNPGTTQVGTLVRRITIPGLLVAPTAIATVSESFVPHEGVITTGVDGVTQTVACMDLQNNPIPDCDDIQRLAVGNGEPNTFGAIASLGRILVSVPAGDDTTITNFGFPIQLATGPNGILDTVVVPPDAPFFAFKRGESFGAAIRAGDNGRLETPVRGDDKIFGVTTLLVGQAGGSVLWLDADGGVLGVFQPPVSTVRGIATFDFFDGNGMQALITTPDHGGSVVRFDLTRDDDATSVLSIVENHSAPAALRSWPGLDSVVQTGDDVPPALVRPDGSLFFTNPSAGERSDPNNVDNTGDTVGDNVAGALAVNILDSPFFDGVRDLDLDGNIRDLFSFFTGRLITEVGRRPKKPTTIRTGPDGVNNSVVCTDLGGNPIPDCDDVEYLPTGKPRRRGVTVDAGNNGICETLPWTNRVGDDVERLPPDEDFWPSAKVGMLPGNNLVIDSPVLGDDVLVTQNVITAGPDGICAEVTPSGDDEPLRLLKLGVPDGTATTLCIIAGLNGALETVPGGDDQIMSAQLVQVGPNKTCDSTIRDSSFIAFGRGQPNQPSIAPGVNKVFDSANGGDDLPFEGVLTSGLNGIAETVPAGDDVRIIPMGRGRNFAPCICAGADGRADTAALGDDRQVVPVGSFPANSIAIGPGPNGVLETPVRGDDVLDRLPLITVKEVFLVSTGPLGAVNIPTANTIVMARPGNQSGVIDVTNGEFAVALDLGVEILLPTSLSIFGPRFDASTGEVDFFLRKVPISGRLNVPTGQAFAYTELGPTLPRLGALYNDFALSLLDDSKIVTSVFGRAAVVVPGR